MSIKRNGGFTLLEVIISIATLSLVSVFVLQMFMASADLNGRAKKADAALTKAITEIDRVKSGVEARTGTEIIYYDKNWQALADIGGNARFVQELTIRPDAGGQGIYVIETEVWELSKEDRYFLLAELDTKKYFP
jgi:prepilin-type N-terminal cleavage/methylation domain-containing protein